jgi:hypothetical protein
MGYKQNIRKANAKKAKKNKKVKEVFQNYLPQHPPICYGMPKGRKMLFNNNETGEQDQVHTNKDNPLQNYHYWLIEKSTGKKIDPTPPQMPAIPGKQAIYIPWSKEEQEEQKNFNINVRKQEVAMLGVTFKDWIESRIKGKIFEKKRCFHNCISLYTYYPDKYELVCGSMGWIMGQTKDGVIGVNMDYGW